MGEAMEPAQTDDLSVRAAIEAARDARPGEVLFGEFAALFKIAIDIRACAEEFLNSRPVIGTMKFDDGAASVGGAGELSFHIEASEGLTSCLAAMRALYKQGNSV